MTTNSKKQSEQITITPKNCWTTVVKIVRDPAWQFVGVVVAIIIAVLTFDGPSWSARWPWISQIPWRLIFLGTILVISATILAFKHKSVKYFFLIMKTKVLTQSLAGFLLRMLSSMIIGIIVMIVSQALNSLVLTRWTIILGATAITWLGLNLASLRFNLESQVKQLEAETKPLHLTEKIPEFDKGLASLCEMADKVNVLESFLPGYPDARDMPWQCRLADVFSSPSDFWTIITVYRDTSESYTGNFSCVGVQHKGIYQHPHLDGKTDSRIRFEIQVLSRVKFVLLTFYTGIADIKTKSDRSVEKSTFEPGKGNLVQFKILIDKGYCIFQETRDTFEWRFHTLILPVLDNQRLRLDFCTNALGQPHCNWAIWGEPRLEDLTIALNDLLHLREISFKGGLHIISAKWGFGDATVDLTEELNARIAEGKLETHATVADLGVDPAPGTVKNLVVQYTAHWRKSQPR